MASRAQTLIIRLIFFTLFAEIIFPFFSVFGAPALPKTESAVSPEANETAPSLSLQAASPSLGPNLIPNPSLESADASGLPAQWHKGGYGTNTRTLNYPASGFADAKAIRTSITSYASGDAKWYFDDIPVTAGKTYQFSDSYYSDVPTVVDVRYALKNGSFRYVDIAAASAAESYQNLAAQLIVPSDAVSLTVFHLIESPGTLTTDNYSLNEVINSPLPVPPPSPGTLLSNGDFEAVDMNGLPQGWGRGRWGANTASFSYPVAGASNSKAAKVAISSYVSGDAKWYFNPIALGEGQYTYTDLYTATVPSVLTVQLQNNDGTFSYKDIGTAPAAGSFSLVSADFSVPPNVKDVTVFHLIQSVGSLIIDKAAVTAKAPPSPDSIFSTGAVSLTFDDGWLSHYTTAVPKLNSAGFKGVFFIVTRQLSDFGFSGFLSKAQIGAMYRMGHEIGAHTRTHPHLTQLSLSAQIDEIAGSRQDIAEMGAGPAPSFAYPYGDYDAATLSIVESAGFFDARATINGAAIPTSDPYQLPRLSVDADTSAATVKRWIDTALGRKEWLILTFHRIDDSGDQYSTTPAAFNEIVDYLTQKKVRVVTLEEGVKILK